MLAQDNNARKGTEEQLKKIKEGEPEKYACYLTAVIIDQNAGADIKALSAVVLRRVLTSTVGETKVTLWAGLS